MTITCVSPIDGSVYAERQPHSEPELNQRIERARAAQRIWEKTPLAERIDCVKRAIKKLEGMNDRVVVELAHQMGRPVRYGGEFGPIKDRTDYMSSIAAESLKPMIFEESENFHRYIAREPIGLILVIAPWNYPYLTALNTIIPGLIAGNTVMLKHASQTILVGEHLADSFEGVGLPDGLFQNVYMTHDISSRFISKGAFNFINFTGSVGGGQSIEKAAAGTFTAVGLELGGKDPAYVREDAKLDVAVETLVDGAMYNSGQCCCGIERIYVHESHFDEFVERAKALTEKYVLGNPLDPETTLGPMANVRFANDIRKQINDAVAAGAKQIVNSNLFKKDDGKSPYLAPQILIHVNHSMELMREESFGPVVGIMKVSNDQQAVELMNDSRYGLTASLWTQDVEIARNIGRQIETGTVFMNRCDYLDPALCWTGCKNTGRGTSLSALGYYSVTRAKSYHLRKI